MTAKKEHFSVGDIVGQFVSTGSWVYALIPALFSLLFAYGASKIAYGQSSSYIVAILAFFFAPIYYAYYALVTYTPPSTLGQILGAARRMRR